MINTYEGSIGYKCYCQFHIDNPQDVTGIIHWTKDMLHKLNTECPLCTLRDRDNTYEDCKEYIILDCQACHIPMLVLKSHTMFLSNELKLNLRNALDTVAKKFYGNEPFIIDDVQNLISDHLHWHARPQGYRRIVFNEDGTTGYVPLAND